MNLLLNGETVDGRDASNVAELVARFGLQPQTVLIEYNGLALHRSEWQARSVHEGDRIEIVSVVAGG